MWTNDLSNQDLIDEFKSYVRKGKYIGDLEQEMLERFSAQGKAMFEQGYEMGYEYGKHDALNEYECNCECECEKEKAQINKLKDAIHNLQDLIY